MTVRKFCTAVLSVIICISLSLTVFAAAVPQKPTAYVNDAADILSENTEKKVAEIAAKLSEGSGCDLALLTQESIEGSMKDFSTEVYKSWGLNPRGALIVLAVENDTYYMILGSVAQQNFTQTDINNMLLEHLEPYFAEENYDGGVLALVKALDKSLTELYYEEPEAEAPAEVKKDSAFVAFLKGFVKFILILGAMLLLVVGFVYLRGQYLRIKRTREQRHEEILSGKAPSSYVPQPRVKEDLPIETTPVGEISFPSYDFDETFEVDMDRDYQTAEDPETKDFDFYKTYTSTKYDFETFSKKK